MITEQQLIYTSLDKLNIGQEAQVGRVRGVRTSVQRLLEMGFTSGTKVKILKFAPLGDPIEVLLRGYHLTLRKEEAAMVEVSLM